MCNKLTILSFALLFSFAIIAQETSTEVNPEINFSNQSLNTENQIEIYPNPAQNQLFIENNKDHAQWQISIRDQVGRIVYESISYEETIILNFLSFLFFKSIICL